MTVEMRYVSGDVAVYDVTVFTVAPLSRMRADVYSVSVFAEGKRVVRRKRPFSWWYRYVTIRKPAIQELIRKEQEAELRRQEQDNGKNSQ